MRASNAAELAQGRWPSILVALGIDEKHLTGKHGPCPACGGHDRFRFDDKEGRGTWYCNGCGAGDGFSLLRNLKGWNFAEAAKEVEAIAGTAQVRTLAKPDEEQQKVARLRRTWEESRPVQKGDPVWLYLHRRVGLDVAPPCLRFHPSLWFDREQSYPAMLARVSYPDGTPATLHRTYLTPDGFKASVDKPKKLMPGKPLKTASVRLFPPAPCLGIAEGIETALAASYRFGVPVWSAISSAILESWEPPTGTKQVIVFGDNDENCAGQAAAFTLAHRLAMRGIGTEVRIPAKAGSDWAEGQKDATDAA